MSALDARPATVTPDWDALDGPDAPLRCVCGLPVVLRYEAMGTVHFDPARDLNLPPECEEAARVLAARDLLALAAADKARAAAVEAELAPHTSAPAPSTPVPVVLRAYAAARRLAGGNR